MRRALGRGWAGQGAGQGGGQGGRRVVRVKRVVGRAMLRTAGRVRFRAAARVAGWAVGREPGGAQADGQDVGVCGHKSNLVMGELANKTAEVASN